MPRPAVEYIPRPYVQPAYEPDNRTIMDLMRLASASRAEVEGRKGANRAAGIMSIGNLISQALQGYQERGLQEKALAQKQAESDRDEAFRRDQLAALTSEREAGRKLQEQAAQEGQRNAAYRRGADIAEQTQYGPIDESQVDDVMAGPAAGRARYVFGPGTAEGPELMPSAAQQRDIQSRRDIEAMGGKIGPNGQVIMPPKVEAPPTPEERLSGEDYLAYLAAQGNKGAIQALKIKQQQRPPSATTNAPDQQFVIRKGVVTPIAKGTAQPGDVPYSADAMQGMGGETSDARASRAAAALNSIEKLKTLAPKRSPGLPGMAEGAVANVAGKLGYNTGARQYDALLQPTAMQMAVAIQGAAGLSNSERESMAKMLGSISTMDYESQMALLENASQMIRGGADVDLMTVKDPKTGMAIERWVPKRSRPQGGLAVDKPVVVDPIDALIDKYRPKGGGQ